MGVRLQSLTKIRFRLLGAFFLIGGAASTWVVTDKVAEKVLNNLRPSLEKKLSETFGHPLQVGPYKGLRVFGLAIGKTQLLPGYKDQSSAEFSSLTIGLAPFASLRHLKPVVIVKPRGARVVLRPNEKGDFWVPGQLQFAENDRPDFDLQLRLSQPAKISIEPAQIDFTLTSRAYLNLSQKKIKGIFQLAFPDKGKLLLKGFGRLDQLELNARAYLERLKLESLQSLLPGLWPVQVKGQLGGDMRLSYLKGRVGCKGTMTALGVEVTGGKLNDALFSKKTSFSCRNDLIKFPLSEWNYGPLVGSFKGEGFIEKSSNIDLLMSASLGLKEFDSPEIKVNAALPMRLKKDGFDIGELQADLNVESFPLSHLGPLFGRSMAGTLAIDGQVKGELSKLKPTLSLQAVNPQIGGLRLQEEWRGDFIGAPGGGGVVRLDSVQGNVPSTLFGRLESNWSLADLAMTRAGGKISLRKTVAGFDWFADDFSVDGIQVAISPSRGFKGIFGKFSGEGNFSFQPFSIKGQAKMLYPRLMGFGLMGLGLREATLNGKYSEKNYSITSELAPPDIGKVILSVKGRLGGELSANAKVRGVSARWLAFSALQLPQFKDKRLSATGNAGDLGTLLVNTFDGSLEGKFKAIDLAKSSLEKDENKRRIGKIIDPEDLRGEIDADVDLNGSDLSSLNLVLDAKGYLWMDGQNVQEVKKSQPFAISFNGALQQSEGNFSILRIPLTLMGLVAPIPSSIQGSFGLNGKYRFKDGEAEASADLILDKAKLAETSFVLDRGKISISRFLVEMDVAVRSKSSIEPITIVGKVPLSSARPIDLRIESHGDGLHFLGGLSDGTLVWKGGQSDLRLLLRGPLNAPQANGFFVIRNGKFIVMEQPLTDLDASIVFDFDRLEVQQLRAQFGAEGSLKGSGAIAFFRSTIESQPLVFGMEKVRFNLPVADVQVDGDLIVKNSLFKPRLGGELTINEGAISPRRSGFKKLGKMSAKSKQDEDLSEEVGVSASTATSRKGISSLLKEWDFQSPLVLQGQDLESPTGQMLRGAFPSIPFVSFDNLRLRLGPNLRITSQPLADFRTAGLLTLNGPLDPRLKASGVVRLLNGRVSLFTTTFNLERRAPNVAVFTPTLGFIPYIDVAMTTRVSEKVGDQNNVASSTIFTRNGSGGGVGVGGFRLVKITLEASGPADRLAENIELRSLPPLTRDQLFGLIGGDSLKELLGGGEKELANVLGKSILSPLLGTITGAFSERLQVAFYPAYVTPEVTDKTGDSQPANQEEVEGGAPSQQAWVTEVGVDLSDRVNLSVLAAPNRQDIPPQGTVSYQVTPNVGLVGSLDNRGTWQSRLQMFFRF